MRLFLATLLALSSLARLATALTYKGADFSSLVVVEKAGKSFTDGGSKEGLETILASHGCNMARIRVWTAGDYTVDYGIALARRARAAGMKIMVDLHFSDTWADPAHQSIPSSWGGSGATLDGLNKAIYDWTNYVVKTFSSSGVPIDILQVGNEINDGFLWPVGRISTKGFSPASQLLHSSIAGAKAAGSPQIALHLANGWDWGTLRWFFNGIFIQGALDKGELNMIGVSFYPFYNAKATLASLKSALNNLIALTGKDVFVAETDWPVQCSGTSMSESSIAISAAGQMSWVAKIRDVLSSLSGGHGIGIFYWEPAWIGNAGLGSSCADNLVVEYSGATRSSIDIFKNM